MANSVAAARTVGETVAELAALLAARGVADARGGARDLLAAILDVPRGWPVAHADAVCDPATVARAQAAARRLAAGAPLAYAVGRAAFRHLTLVVDERVLIPRPETELLVDEVLASGLAGGLAVDVGTGSGALALALATEGRFDRVIATDVSLDALAVAAHNRAAVAGVLRAPVEFRHGSLLAPVAGLRARVVVSNPPYIAFDEAGVLPASVRDWEPAVALLSGDGGLAASAALVAEAAAVLEPGGLLALEVDSRRARATAALALADGRYSAVVVKQDLSGRDRFVLATRA